MPSKVALIVKTGVGCYVCDRGSPREQALGVVNAHLHLIAMGRKADFLPKGTGEMKRTQPRNLREFLQQNIFDRVSTQIVART